MLRDGNALARVLLYYKLIYDTAQAIQKIICPIHEDVRPSMSIDLYEGRYYCFGCGISGTAVDFVMEHEHIKEWDACRKVAHIIHDKELQYEDITHHEPKDRIIDKNALEDARHYYYGLSRTNWLKTEDTDAQTALQYMLDRGFTEKYLNYIGCRHNPTSWSYPLIFPIMDNGHFMGWLSRTDKKSVEAKRKYLYNTGFSRANTVCGRYDTKSIVYIVEGYMDMFSMFMLGVRNVVAILGWKITAEQIKKLKAAGVTHVVSALDNDKCGIDGTQVLKQHFTVTRFRYLKRFKDPGEFDAKSFEVMNNKTLEQYRRRYKRHGRNVAKNETTSRTDGRQQR